MKSLFSVVSLFALNASLFLGSFAHADSPTLPAGTVPSVPSVPAAPAQPGIAGMVLPFAAMFAVVYFLMIRPQQKKAKEAQGMMESLKQGDEVLTASGILGKITGITDKVVTLEIADGVRVKMIKSQISQVIKGQIKDLA
ncbi:MAG: preprotein translocase subunit YajC [Oligoflexia bacterium]|nr:preprotein translocase subunit YajC [Oligoflexia bacterium]